MLTRRLLRQSAVTCRQNLHQFSSSPSSSSSSVKMMGGDRNPDGSPDRRGLPYGRGSVSAGKSSMCKDDRSSKSSIDCSINSPQIISPKLGQTSHEEDMGSSNVRSPERESNMHPFGICTTESGGPVTLNNSLSELNLENRTEHEQSKQVSPNKHVRSGMVSVKNFISHHDQVSTGKSSTYRDDRSSKSPIDCMINSPQIIRPRLRQTSQEEEMGSSNVRSPVRESKKHPFDICETESGGPVKLKKSILEVNREKRKELEQSKQVSLNKHQVSLNKHLRSGMVLLKNFISHRDQVRIVERCRELGMGFGGFYKPGYGDGAKLHLQMMCLGMNWDPVTRSYEDKRPTDGATPPRIPEDFRNLVDRAIQASYDFLRENSRGINVEDELPSMSPDICIVNFYSKNGKLGLHQDRDESDNSLYKGLPVVSFSLGDSADFLYGEGRNVDIAEKVVLESGDVLIFGGKSRHLFHGVSSIIPNTAPKRLIDQTKLRPGRLNLTFRQY